MNRKLRLAATVVALLSVAVAAWLYGIGQVKALTLDARERSVVKACMAYGVAEAAWIDGEGYCLVHFYTSGMEIVSGVPLSQMGVFTGMGGE